MDLSIHPSDHVDSLISLQKIHKKPAVFSVKAQQIPRVRVSSQEEAVSHASAAIKSQQLKLNQEIAEIAQEKKIAIETVQNNTVTQQHRALQRGHAIVSSADITSKKNEALSQIQIKARHQARLAYFSYRKGIIEHQPTIFHSIFEKRQHQINSSTTASLKQEDLEKTQAIIEQSLEIEKKIVELFRDSITTVRDEDLVWALQMIDATDALRTVILANDVDDYLADATAQLEDVKASLKTISASNGLSDHDKFSSQETIVSFQGTLRQDQADFLLAEALSDEKARIVATQHVIDLSKRAQELNLVADQTRDEVPIARTEEKDSLTQRVEILQTLALALEKAAQAYQEIADVYSIPIRSTGEMKRGVVTACKKLQLPTVTAGSEISGEKQFLAKQLEQLSLSCQTIQDSTEAYDLTFLSQLHTLSDHDADIISGNHRGIILEPRLSAISDTDRTRYRHGMNLIRLALLRDFGIDGVQRFDERFSAKIGAHNPLAVQELKTLMQQLESSHKQSSYFLSSIDAPGDALTELLLLKDAQHDAKVIKSEGSSFNPFLSASSSSQNSVVESEAVERGISVVRGGIEDALKKMSLPQRQMDSVMTNFNNEFTSIGKNTPLTIGALKTFLQKQFQQSQQYNISSLLSGPIFNSIVWNIFTSGVLTLRSTPVFLRFAASPYGAALVFLSSLAIEIFEDLTVSSRMLHEDPTQTTIR
ncbi:MAG: hypothetical protein A3F67_01870 [Verrucomicrobia bacterium RIFCSPHIGHO2_12_FULL_41_10]|nr:MAG: hypothetical protein A3F67_01870 [Verrucomicrobia bacterium RIFCSPHIGHO2_12_FULL_41_10]HLB34126.1 hypothetical protein [Chthoniobacterales bacterium]